MRVDTFRTPQQVIRDLPAPEELDYDPPPRASPRKQARHSQARNRLHYGNVTNFGRQVIDCYWTRDSEVYIFAATHLDPQRRHEICQYVNIRGRTPAWPNPDNNGTRGGLLVLADLSRGLTEVEAFTAQGCGYQAFLWQATECAILPSLRPHHW